jgi:hypothetical protein
VNEEERDEIGAPIAEESDANEAVDEPVEDADDPAPGDVNPRDALSIALVVGLGALLLLCVILVFVANRHRPAGL